MVSIIFIAFLLSVYNSPKEKDQIIIEKKAALSGTFSGRLQVKAKVKYDLIKRHRIWFNICLGKALLQFTHGTSTIFCPFLKQLTVHKHMLRCLHFCLSNAVCQNES